MSEQVIKVVGGNTLRGEVSISGAKNSAVALIPATVMANGVVTLDSLPEISDVKTLMSLLEDLTIDTEMIDECTIKIDASHAVNKQLPNHKVQSLRASYYMMGALLGRFNYCDIALPGGCPLGPRPIDQHIKGFKALGAEVIEDGESMKLSAPNGLIGTKIFLDVVSVGATINIMLAASRAKGKTVIENAAKEPEIIDVATLLNKMGAKVKGAGTDTIKITGVNDMNGATHSVIPDRIEAGTYMCVAAACGEEVRINNIIPDHMEALTMKLKEMNVSVQLEDDYAIIKRPNQFNPVHIKTNVYPGFATDLQQPITPLFFLAEGKSTITETIYPERFRHVDELKNMDADVHVENGSATYHAQQLKGTDVYASDLRAGACLMIAGLIADGTTTIHNVRHIDRGYSDIVSKLKAIGANIWREDI